MAFTELPPIEFLRECFDYDPETGVIRWKHRPEHHFDKPHIAKAWNSRLAGQPALVGVDKDGYHRGELTFDGRRLRLRAHRVAFALLTGEEPEIVDHKNHDTADNRGENLRAATFADNARNHRGFQHRALPKGVYKGRSRFEARAYDAQGRKTYLGAFDTPDEAYAAYCTFAKATHGEFFNPGPPRIGVFA